MLRRRFVIQAIAAALVNSAAPACCSRKAPCTPTPIDPFGQEITLVEKTIVYASGTGDWDTAYDTLMEAFKSIQAFLDKQGDQGHRARP